MSRRGLFITGTDTGVGKTVVTSLLAKALLAEEVRQTSLSVGAAMDENIHRTVAAYKPACSGAEWSVGSLPATPDPDPYWPDIESLFAATGGVWSRERIGPQRFIAPLSPPAAAALEGRDVDEALLLDGYHWLAERADVVLVEGAGGFYSPISANWLNADLAERIGLPVLVVSPNRLGTINQTLLTIEAVQRRGLAVAGVVLNRLTGEGDDSVASNAAEIQRRGGVSVWGEIPFRCPSELQPERLPESMISAYRSFIS